jgi:DNA-binding NarL/FixJ family response regulator
LLIDDHASFCEGFKAAMLAVTQDYNVDFETDSRRILGTLASLTQYDLFIIDLMLPGLSGIDLLRYLNETGNQTPVIILSSVQQQDLIEQAFRLGAIGFLPKSCSIHQIIDAIEHCRQGNLHVPLNLVATINNIQLPSSAAFEEKHTGHSANDDSSSTDEVRLTKRQQEIISLMDTGFSNQKISDKLFISKARVETLPRERLPFIESRDGSLVSVCVKAALSCNPPEAHQATVGSWCFMAVISNCSAGKTFYHCRAILTRCSQRIAVQAGALNYPAHEIEQSAHTDGVE